MKLNFKWIKKNGKKLYLIHFYKSMVDNSYCVTIFSTYADGAIKDCEPLVRTRFQTKKQAKKCITYHKKNLVK